MTGEVYHAVHQLLPRRAVVKVLAGDQPFAIQMLREACILEALHHPGIVRVYESGLLPDRRPWFACELVEGPSINNVLAPGARDRIDAIALLRDIAEVLEHAHRRGVIHCGLRPQRVVLTGRSRGFPLCITDWSDARAHDAAPMPYVPSVASWQFTSPELAGGDAIDDRVDVYALGVIAYQLLTGVLPFVGRAIATTGRSHEHMPTEVHCPDAPRELTRLVDQMLSHDRWDRPSTAEVQTELSFLLDTLATPTKSPASLLRIRRPRWTPAIAFDDAPPPPGDALAMHDVRDEPAS
ncbi:MAG: serine/threonine protein kinase [Deltaproteobacteria bacterium]|nr:serine/threonine protein kinase [Deltaproteobacteria bacterium]